MKNRILVYIIGIILIFVGSFYIGKSIFAKYYNSNPQVNDDKTVTKDVSNSEERVSPNAIITFKKTYNKCAHTKQKTKKVPEKLVNLTKEELKEIYKEWKLEKFSKEEIVLIKNEDDYCEEHYVLRNIGGYITVFSIDEGNKEQIYLSTDIAVEYLPETDKENLQTGIYIYGSDKLTEVLQDFE